MMGTAGRQKGFLMAELMVAMGLLGLIVAGMAVSLGGFTAFNRYLWTRQRCTAAAQAQLDSLVATGKPIAPQDLKRLWSGVEVSVDTKPGAPPWNGLRLIEVTATAPVGGRQVTIHLARYVLSDDKVKDL
jgi:type II secretory pathway pseudopilin PulG